MPNVYFGERLDIPAFDDDPDDPSRNPIRTATPVGEPCVGCDEPVEQGDCGVMENVVTVEHSWWRKLLRRPPRMAYRFRPTHAECFMRSRLGGLAHMVGRCGCRGLTETPYPGSPRQEALAVVAVINEQRSGQGLPPLKIRVD